MTKEELMREAIRLSELGMQQNKGGPFGCVVAHDNVIIGRGNNEVTSTNDPTAHAEVVAIREACRTMGTFELTGCEIFTSCEPCPMCLGAIYWARIAKIYFACTRTDAAFIGFDDDFLYTEIPKPIRERIIPAETLMREEGLKVFEQWIAKPDKIEY